MSQDAISEELGDEVELPAATVTVKHRQTGGSIVAVVLVSMGLVPFVQAVMSAFGSKLADAVDGATRRAVRRLLDRAHQPPEVPGQPDRIHVSVSLTDDGSGARVMLPDDLPAEAVVQLVRLASSGSAVPGGTVIWHPEGNPAGKWYLESEGRFTSQWNHAAHEWQPVAHSGG